MTDYRLATSPHSESMEETLYMCGDYVVVFVGIFWSLVSVVVVDLLGDSHKDHAIGDTFACLGVASLCSGPLAGRKYSLQLRFTFKIICLPTVLS